ncbi:MAG: hypothetical protein ACKORJ_06240 [Bacteroidota bacterium]
MKWQNKLFILIVVLLAAGMAIASWDIARKTTFPGSKSQLKERIKKQFIRQDTLPNNHFGPVDSLKMAPK